MQNESRIRLKYGWQRHPPTYLHRDSKVHNTMETCDLQCIGSIDLRWDRFVRIVVIIIFARFVRRFLPTPCRFRQLVYRAVKLFTSDQHTFRIRSGHRHRHPLPIAGDSEFFHVKRHILHCDLMRWIDRYRIRGRSILIAFVRCIWRLIGWIAAGLILIV